MKAVLVFKLPAEDESFEIAKNGWKYKQIIDSLDHWLRQLEKYEDKGEVSIREVRRKITDLEKEWLKDEDL